MTLRLAKTATTGKWLRFGPFLKLACVCATLAILFSAIHNVAHDHEDHASDYGGECTVCTIASLDKARSTSDAPTNISPTEIWTKAPQSEYIQRVISLKAKPNPARGPPLHVSS